MVQERKGGEMKRREQEVFHPGTPGDGEWTTAAEPGSVQRIPSFLTSGFSGHQFPFV